MPLLFFATIALQVACAVHCARTGRSGTWVMIILFLPVVGSLAYVVMEVLPGSGVTQTAGKAKAKVAAKLDPDKPIRLAREGLETADTAANRVALANALAERGLWDEAIPHYEQGEL